MAIPYSETYAQALDDHLRIKHDGSWKYVEDVQVKHAGSWRDVKEVYVKHAGTWRMVHEGEHFLFNATIGSNSTSEWSLSSHISGLGYGGNKIKGVVTVNAVRSQVNLGNFSNDSKVYLRVNSNQRITGKGGDGGNRGGQNGQGGQRALYTRTPFILDNAGVIAGGGGGGAGGNNAQCTYQNTYYYGCMKGNQCSGTSQNFSTANGGGGGGGAGYPGGQGKHGGQNGQQWGGGGGGGNDGCGSNSGGQGGNLGAGGQNAGGSGGGGGTAIDGWSERYAQNGSGDGDIRGGKTN